MERDTISTTTQETPQDSLNCNYFYSRKTVNILQT